MTVFPVCVLVSLLVTAGCFLLASRCRPGLLSSLAARLPGRAKHHNYQVYARRTAW